MIRKFSTVKEANDYANDEDWIVSHKDGWEVITPDEERAFELERKYLNLVKKVVYH